MQDDPAASENRKQRWKMEIALTVMVLVVLAALMIPFLKKSAPKSESATWDPAVEAQKRDERNLAVYRKVRAALDAANGREAKLTAVRTTLRDNHAKSGGALGGLMSTARKQNDSDLLAIIDAIEAEDNPNHLESMPRSSAA